MPEKIRVVLGGSEGRVGRVLQRLVAEADDMELVARIDPTVNREGIQFPSIGDFNSHAHMPYVLSGFEGAVYVDFTHPDTVIDNIRMVSELGFDSVIGTGGWYDREEEVRDIALRNKRRIIGSPNFSTGANFLAAVVKLAAEKLGRDYDIGVVDVHHRGKKDVPSGTAVELGKAAAEHAGGGVNMVGLRVGSVIGHHAVWIRQ